VQEIVNGLRFPEGPIAMPDGSVILVEIARGTLTRVWDGKTEVIADLGGGPNGAALGPDGAVYICNNGGSKHYEKRGLLIPGGAADDYLGGSIQRVELETGKFDTLYTDCNDNMLSGPNDIAFDETGGFWFTDYAKFYDRTRDLGGIYYARPDGSEIKEVVFPISDPNGIGISPNGKVLYAAETNAGRLWAWNITGPGELELLPTPARGRLVTGSKELQMFDSLAVDADGNVCVATLLNGGISIVSPDDGSVTHVPTGDPLTTNICFGGNDLKTAYITLSGTGKLVSADWPTAGTPLWFLNQ